MKKSCLITGGLALLGAGLIAKACARKYADMKNSYILNNWRVYRQATLPVAVRGYIRANKKPGTAPLMMPSIIFWGVEDALEYLDIYCPPKSLDEERALSVFVQDAVSAQQSYDETYGNVDTIGIIDFLLKVESVPGFVVRALKELKTFHEVNNRINLYTECPAFPEAGRAMVRVREIGNVDGNVEQQVNCADFNKLTRLIIAGERKVVVSKKPGEIVIDSVPGHAYAWLDYVFV